MDVPQVDGLVVAFCGIARPEQFFDGLERAGLRHGGTIRLPDHHRYTAHDLERIAAEARRTNAAALVTTEKDRVRLGARGSRIFLSRPFLCAWRLKTKLPPWTGFCTA